MRKQLDEHARCAQDRLTGSLKEYFDPAGRRFNQRVQRLVADDGDLGDLKLSCGDASGNTIPYTVS
ncbi:MAG: hypothetical protein MKZ95_02785 [Pirellulales bacterium]|nr:hypothetical protein [Pirellulales bacterium]